MAEPPIVRTDPSVLSPPACYPRLLQVNTRTWLTALGQTAGRPITLAEVPDAALDRWVAQGYDWLWLLGVWRVGPAVQAAARGNEVLRRELLAVLPDVTDADICGSCFAIAGYDVDETLGGDAALASLRTRMAERGLRLMLDFIPNHVGLDHPWVGTHPEWFVHGTAADLADRPLDWIQLDLPGGPTVLAHGRDPHFPGWSDTLQLNYGVPALQAAMAGELRRVAARCDGVRCDMAMLVLPEVFETTWGVAAEPFWPRAIAQVKEAWPGFLFLAEVYWDLEWTLHQQGFDMCYDKRLYDRLRSGPAAPVREHLAADPRYQSRLARFLENHDEPRALTTFGPGQYQAAAVVTYLTPGLRFFHDGQREGHRLRVPMQLCRAPHEPAAPDLADFYDQLAEVLRHPVFRAGDWQLLPCQPPAPEEEDDADHCLAWAWTGAGGARWLIVVRYGPEPGHCAVVLPPGWPPTASLALRLADAAGAVAPGAPIRDGALVVELAAWGFRVFEVVAA
jgi:hypothetical protein